MHGEMGRGLMLLSMKYCLFVCVFFCVFFYRGRGRGGGLSLVIKITCRILEIKTRLLPDIASS